MRDSLPLYQSLWNNAVTCVCEVVAVIGTMVSVLMSGLFLRMMPDGCYGLAVSTKMPGSFLKAESTPTKPLKTPCTSELNSRP